jgi:hypothetical protein
MDAKTFDAFAGRYQLPEGRVMIVRRENERFLTQVPGQPAFEMLPESDHEFFMKAYEAEVSFITDGRGRATEMIIREDGENVYAKRIE